MNATYSPDDNKLRLYASTRLDRETYERVKRAGFRWAPRQDLFVAPMWTPEREDLLLELCDGEIGDEDTSLVDRAEERADRFSDYSQSRLEDYDAAHRAVKAIADNIPLGQPILVGHHSERRARKDAERIDNGMRRAVKMWRTAEYWKDRAAGALRHAKYKERPDVRARRIKGIEADQRKSQKSKDQLERLLKFWSQDLEAITLERALALCNLYDRGGVKLESGERHWSAWSALNDGKVSIEELRRQRLDSLPKTIAHYDRWLEHYARRLDYERAMLAEGGGLITDRTEFPIVVGGQVLVRNEWLVVTKVNLKDGKIVSVSTNSRYVRVKGIEEVADYRPPTEAQAEAVQAALKLPPMVNYDGVGHHRMTSAEYTQLYRDWKSTRVVPASPGEFGRYRYRVIYKGGQLLPVFLTDKKVVEKPPYVETTPKLPSPERVLPTEPAAPAPAKIADPREADAKQLETAVRAGVQVVSAPQLFVTPAHLARQLVELAEIGDPCRVLEPSAGTGALVRAIKAQNVLAEVTAVEVNQALADQLRRQFPTVNVCATDFLGCNGDLGTFDAVVMNPPFVNGEDIKHILHARGLLRAGGRLAAICANGPRQQEKLKPLAERWIDLPEGSFKDAGTNVNAAMLLLRR